MSEDLMNSGDKGICPMEQLIFLSREISVKSTQLRAALKLVQDNFKLSGGLTIESQKDFVYKGQVWNWQIIGDRLMIVVEPEIKYNENIPREVVIELIKDLPGFLHIVEGAYLSLKKALGNAKDRIETINDTLKEKCIGCGRSSIGMDHVQELGGSYPYCPDCLIRAYDNKDIVKISSEQKIGSLYLPAGTYVETLLISRFEW